MNRILLVLYRKTVGFALGIGIFSGLLLWGYQTVYAAPPRLLDRPLLIGPQYPFYQMFATFLPESAYVLPAGSFTFDYFQTQTNSFEFSSNSEKNHDKNADAKEFRKDDKGGYSVYIDMQLRRTHYRLALGIYPGVEIQYMRTTMSAENSTGLDNLAENFHKNLGIRNFEREQASQGDFDFYVYDNENEKYLLEFSDASQFANILDLAALKLQLMADDHYAVAFKVTSSWHRMKTENTDDEYEKANLDEKNYTLYGSLFFQPVSIHAAASITVMPNSIFEESPTDLHQYFLGFNYHASDNWDILLQGIQYTSVYPERDEGNSDMSDDVQEVTFGVRYIWEDTIACDMGFVENVTQGPNNIDIAFFFNLSLAY